MPRLFLLAIALAAPVHAEERTFAVTIDGKPAGECSLTVQRRDDGRTAVSYTADYVTGSGTTRVSHAYRGFEVWKDNRLVRLDGSGSATGRKTTISMVAGRDGFDLKAGAKEVTVRAPDVWTDSHWTLPDPTCRTATVIDTATGDVLQAKVEKVGVDRLTAASKVILTTRYRVTAGGTSVDLWYDAGNRLVRRTWSVDGRPAVMELTHTKSD